MGTFKIVRVLVIAMFIIVPVLMVVGGIWQYSMYRDCIADGHKSYQCAAMLNQNARYVAIDDISNN